MSTKYWYQIYVYVRLCAARGRDQSETRYLLQSEAWEDFEQYI